MSADSILAKVIIATNNNSSDYLQIKGTEVSQTITAKLGFFGRIAKFIFGEQKPDKEFEKINAETRDSIMKLCVHAAGGGIRVSSIAQEIAEITGFLKDPHRIVLKAQASFFILNFYQRCIDIPTLKLKGVTIDTAIYSNTFFDEKANPVPKICGSHDKTVAPAFPLTSIDSKRTDPTEPPTLDKPGSLCEIHQESNIKNDPLPHIKDKTLLSLAEVDSLTDSICNMPAENTEKSENKETRFTFKNQRQIKPPPQQKPQENIISRYYSNFVSYFW